MERLDPPSDAVRTRSSAGEVMLWRVNPFVVVIRIDGVFDGALASQAVEQLEGWLRIRPRLQIFADLDHSTGHMREARDYMTNFSKQHAAEIESVEFLFSSAFMALAVGAFKFVMASRGLEVHAYSQRGSWLEALERSATRADIGP
jgi:hypothetical protein